MKKDGQTGVKVPKEAFFSFLSRTQPNSQTVNIYCCWLIIQRDRMTDFECVIVQHIYCTNCTVCNWTVLTVITQMLLLHVQLHNSTAHLLYKYCTKCTVCNWTVLTVITQMLLLYVQLHNSTAYLLYKYCTNCTACNWTVLTVNSHKLVHMFSCKRAQKMSADVFCSGVQPDVWYFMDISIITSRD